MLFKHKYLEPLAVMALRRVQPPKAVKVLAELESKMHSIRKPSAWICKAVRTLEEEEARRNGTVLAPAQAPAPPPEGVDEQAQYRTLLARWPQLDGKALTALEGLPPGLRIKAIQDMEAKISGIRNISAWMCRTAHNMRERERDRVNEAAGAAGGPADKEQAEEPPAGLTDLVDHYAALEVEPSSDQTVIKKAYRKLVLKWHPDKHPEDRDKAEELIRAINNAYETLSNPVKREAYDAQREAIEQWKRGAGPRASQLPKQHIPKDFMLQPLGYPDKFVRYASENVRAQCFVHSRADARLEGLSGLDSFVPFFKACKLSLWWLPDVNNMCRIRALEIGTKYTHGEAVGAGRPGGLNLGFQIEQDGRDAPVKLMDARKGEKNENVNFIVVPSPFYESAYRFEAACHKNYFLAFQPPTHFRMVKASGAALLANAVLDFTLVNFDQMFKYLDIEEVLMPAAQGRQGWIQLEDLRCDQRVQLYFANVLDGRVWDDGDFAAYFDAHFEVWEFRCTAGGSAVRLRSPEERLGQALAHARDADEASQRILEAGDALPGLPWRYAAAAMSALAGPPGPEDAAARAVRRIEAQRRLLRSVPTALAFAADEASLGELAALAAGLERLCRARASPDVVAAGAEASQRLGQHVVRRLADADAAGAPVRSGPLRLEEVGPLLALPSVAAKGSLLLRHTEPLDRAPAAALRKALVAARAAGADAVAEDAAAAVFARLSRGDPSEAAEMLGALVAEGFELDRCARALARQASVLDTGNLAGLVQGLGERGVDSHELEKAADELSHRGMALEQLPSAVLLGLAVASTKSAALAVCLGKVANSAMLSLWKWPTGEAIKLMLALAKAKGGLSGSSLRDVLREISKVVSPHLESLPAAELIRLALAAASSKLQDSAFDLQEAVAREATRRLSDLQPAHLLLLTQGLVSLGGRHHSVRQVCGFWSELLFDDGGAEDAVSERRRDLEKGRALSIEQLAKLAGIIAPVEPRLDQGTSDRLGDAIGGCLAHEARGLSDAARDRLLEQLRADGAWRWLRLSPRIRRALEY